MRLSLSLNHGHPIPGLQEEVPPHSPFQDSRKRYHHIPHSRTPGRGATTFPIPRLQEEVAPYSPFQDSRKSCHPIPHSRTPESGATPFLILGLQEEVPPHSQFHDSRRRCHPIPHSRTPGRGATTLGGPERCFQVDKVQSTLQACLSSLLLTAEEFHTAEAFPQPLGHQHRQPEYQ